MHTKELIDMWLDRAGVTQDALIQHLEHIQNSATLDSVSYVSLTGGQFYQWYKNHRRAPHSDPDLALEIVRFFVDKTGYDGKPSAQIREALDFLCLTRLPLNRFGELKSLYGERALRRTLTEWLRYPL